MHTLRSGNCFASPTRATRASYCKRWRVRALSAVSALAVLASCASSEDSSGSQATGMLATPVHDAGTASLPSAPSAAAPSGQGQADEPGLMLLAATWGPNAQRFSGIEFCMRDAARQCVVTDQSGQALLPGLPELAPVALSVTGPGYVGLLKHLVAPSHDIAVPRDPFTPLITTELWTQWAAQSGVTLEPNKGHIVAYVLRGAGGSVELRPSAGVRAHFFSSIQEVDPALDHFGEPGYAVFFNVPVGEYDAVFSKPGSRCIFGMETGWPGDSSDSSKVTVAAGLASFPAFGICLPR